MSEPISRFSTVQMIGKGVDAAPALRRGIGVTVLLAMVGAAGRVAIPLMLTQAIDRGFRDGEVRLPVIYTVCALGLVAVTVSAVAQRAAVVRLGIRAEEALYGLRVRLFEHIHRLSIADHNDERKGALVARVTGDVETLAQFFSWGALAWLLDGTLMILVAAVMLSYNWLLALVAFVVAAPLVVVLRRLQGSLARAYDDARGRNAEVMTAVSEAVNGSETIRAYGAGDHYAARAKTTSHRRSSSFIRAGTFGAFLFPSGEVFGALTVSSVVVVGVARGPASGLTSGAMVGFVLLTYRFLDPIAGFTETIDQTQTAVAGLRRVIGVLETPVGPPEPTQPITLPQGPLSVAVEGVTFSYPPRGFDDADEPPVLVNVSALIPPGQQVALVGETGSGKTTLGRLIARLADPTVGVVRVGGVPLTAVGNDDLRQRMVVVPQEPFLFDGTIAMNLSFARPGSSWDDLARAVERLGVSEWLESLPEGLATEVGQRGAALSAGERQLVALVRASLADPAVLVLDEATSSVDALTEVRLGRALEALAVGRTTISIAHRLSTAARADRVLVLHDGRLVEDGAHADLVSAGGHYARMYDNWVAATQN
jgi:ATP-binding cassette, subfamily B, bacterial